MRLLLLQLLLLESLALLPPHDALLPLRQVRVHLLLQLHLLVLLQVLLLLLLRVQDVRQGQVVHLEAHPVVVAVVQDDRIVGCPVHPLLLLLLLHVRIPPGWPPAHLAPGFEVVVFAATDHQIFLVFVFFLLLLFLRRLHSLRHSKVAFVCCSNSQAAGN